MTLNIVISTWPYIACASDRRLTNGRRVVSERANKLIQFSTKDAHGWITYNGVGLDSEGLWPCEWVVNLPNSALDSFDAMLSAIRSDAQPRIDRDARFFGGNPRHSFVVVAYRQMVPAVALISNYESLDRENRSCALPELQIEKMKATAFDAKGAALVMGDHSALTKARIKKQLFDKVMARSDAKVVAAAMKKVVRDASYRAGRRGTVGSSVAVGVTPMFGEATYDVHVPGGTVLHELPYVLSPHMRLAGGVTGGPSAYGELGARYDATHPTRTIVREALCSNCKNPVPEGYGQCPVCDRRT